MNPFPLFFGMALLALPASAQEAGFPVDAVVRVAGLSAGSALNVRADAGTDTAIVASLPDGEAGLTILECTASADWCRVATIRGPLGWVASRYLARVDDASPGGAAAEPRFNEATRLSRITGTAIASDATVTVPELPPHLLGEWDDDRAACARENDETRVTVLKNGLRIGAATARFKNAIFREEGYDLTTLLIEERDVMNAVPQRALYRLEPGEDALSLSGDVLATRQLQRCARP